jgi:phosphohistidine swiveling domain-containing protein
MADNFVTDAGSGGNTYASDDIGGTHHPRVKIEHGADGSATDVSTASPLPVDLRADNLGADLDVNVNTTSLDLMLGTDFSGVFGAVSVISGGRVLVDGSGVTQPVSAASLPLPSGAATAANQLADGHNVTIDNAAGGSAVNVQDGGNSLTIDNADLATIAGDTTSLDGKDLMLGTDFSAVFGTATLVTTAQADALANTLDSINATAFAYVFNGTSWDRVREGGTAGSILVDGSGVTQPVSASSLPLPSGAATAANQLADGHNVTIDNAAGASAVNIQDGGNTISVDGTVAATQSGTWTVQPGNTPNTSPWLVNDRPDTTGGLSMSKLISAASTNSTNVKASAGQLYAIEVFNTNANPRYFKLYNKASAPTIGTDTPVKTITLPGRAEGAGVVINWDKGLAFSLGIGFGLTTGVADADTGAVAASEIVVNVNYK